MAGERLDGAWVPYCGAAPDPSELLAQWNLDPLLLAVFVAMVLLWHARFHKHGRGQPGPFAIAIAALLLLFVSPLCALTSALFAARAAHHALLIAAAAPLLALSVASGPRRLPIWAMTGLQAIVLWAWHVPSLYSAALASDAIYWAMQASLLACSVAFWIAVRQAPVPLSVGALLATMVQMGLLGAVITFASSPLYAPHLLTTAAWGLTPLEDQQLGGLIMWVPAAALYLLAALLIAGRWLRNEGAAAAR